MRTLLRTMTKKSMMNFGKYPLLRVGELMARGPNSKDYLRWCYFNLDKVNYTEDVLDEIGITREFRIAKPGKDPELHIPCRMAEKERMSDEERMAGARAYYGAKKARTSRYNRNSNYSCSKGFNQQMSQKKGGH